MFRRVSGRRATEGRADRLRKILILALSPSRATFGRLTAPSRWYEYAPRQRWGGQRICPSGATAPFRPVRLDAFAVGLKVRCEHHAGFTVPDHVHDWCLRQSRATFRIIRSSETAS